MRKARGTADLGCATNAGDLQTNALFQKDFGLWRAKFQTRRWKQRIGSPLMGWSHRDTSSCSCRAHTNQGLPTNLRVLISEWHLMPYESWNHLCMSYFSILQLFQTRNCLLVNMFNFLFKSYQRSTLFSAVLVFDTNWNILKRPAILHFGQAYANRCSNANHIPNACAEWAVQLDEGNSQNSQERWDNGSFCFITAKGWSLETTWWKLYQLSINIMWLMYANIKT